MGQMWFGTRGYMQWIPCPDVDGSAPTVGWSVSTQHLAGGMSVRSSTAAHKEYSWSWNGVTRDEIRPVLDYAAGVYDSQPGINLVYFQDPIAMDQNVLPALWASPFQTAIDGLSLFVDQSPEIITTPANSLRYPARSVIYTANTPSRSLWVPIPPGYTAWVGVHGSGDGSAGVLVATTNGLASGTPVLQPFLSVTDSTRFSTSFAASSTVDGILLSLSNNGPTSTDSFTWSGTMVQILKNGTTPTAGGFISGQGNSGCQFAEKPGQTAYSAYYDIVGVSAELRETGSWL